MGGRRKEVLCMDGVSGIDQEKALRKVVPKAVEGRD